MPSQNNSGIDGAKSKPRGKHARVDSGLIPRIDDADEENDSLASQETSMMNNASVANVDLGATQAFKPTSDDFDAPSDSEAAFFSNNGVTAAIPQQYAAAQFGANGFDGVDMPKDHSKVGKIVGITLGVIVGILLVIYLAGAFIFSDRLFPNTKMGDLDVSLQSTADLRQTINKRVDGYVLTVTGPNGYSQKISASDVGLVCDENVSLDRLVPNRNIWMWPVEIFRSHEISNGVDTSYNLALVQSVVGTAVDTYNATAKQPTNASLAFNATKNSFEVVPETTGTALDKAVVVQQVIQAMADVQDKLVLDSSSLLKPAVVSTDTRLNTAVASANKMIQANVTYTMGGVEVAKLTPATISGWIVIDDQCNASLDTDKLNAWIEQTASVLDTTGSKRTYTRSDGKVITVEGGAYGWEVDNEAFADQVRADVAEGTTKTSAIPCSEEGEGFTAVGGADWGKRYIDVDLSEQHVYFYDATGTIIWDADCISGAPSNDHATPQGVWYVVTKESPSKLIGYAEDGVTKEYETTVTFWMPFEGNGVGFHDATWQPSFGGTMYADGYGSHGCINLSYSDAESLYSIIQPNDVVVVHE